LTGGRAIGIGLFGLLLMSSSQRVTPSIASGIIREHLHLTGSEFGVLAGASALAFGVSQFPGGYLSDVFGSVRVVRLAAIVSSAATIVFLTAPSYPIALAGRIVFGVADSILFVSMMRFAVGSRSRGGALQIGKTQAAVSGAFAGAGLVGLGLTAATFPLLFGALAVLQAALAATIRAPASAPGPRAAAPSAGEIGEVLRSRQFWVAALATAGLFGPFLAWTSGWAVPYLVSVVGLTTDQARLVIVGDGAAGVAGALLLGRLSDVLERRRLMMLFGGVLMTVAWGVLIILGSRGPAAVAVSMTLLVGFSFPTCNSSLVLAKESFRPDRAGSVLGLSNAASSIAAAVVGAVAGLALDAGWHGAFDNGIRAYPVAAYAAIPAVMLVASSLAVIGGLLVRETYGRQLEIPSPP
jgi:predicted MFS family arabinose efflux permease